MPSKPNYLAWFAALCRDGSTSIPSVDFWRGIWLLRREKGVTEHQILGFEKLMKAEKVLESDEVSFPTFMKAINLLETCVSKDILALHSCACGTEETFSRHWAMLVLFILSQVILAPSFFGLSSWMLLLPLVVSSFLGWRALELLPNTTMNNSVQQGRLTQTVQESMQLVVPVDAVPNRIPKTTNPTREKSWRSLLSLSRLTPLPFLKAELPPTLTRRGVWFHLAGYWSSMAVVCLPCFFGFSAFAMPSLPITIPWASNWLLLLSLGVFTLWTRTSDSRMRLERDRVLLEGYPVCCHPPSETKNALDLLLEIQNQASESNNSSWWKITYLRFLALTIPALLMCLMTPLYIAITKICYVCEVLEENNFPAELIYLFYVLGAPAILLSWYIFFSYVWRYTHSIFQHANLCLHNLNAITSQKNAVRLNLSYLPLDCIENVLAWGQLHFFFKTYTVGEVLGEASTGFASLLLVDVILAASIVVDVYFVRSIRAGLVMGYYVIFITHVVLKLLAVSVQMNKELGNYVRVLGKQQVVLASRQHQATDPDESKKIQDVRTILETMKSHMEASADPVRVLGIPTTPTLTRVVAGYFGSAAVAAILKVAISEDMKN